MRYNKDFFYLITNLIGIVASLAGLLLLADFSKEISSTFYTSIVAGIFSSFIVAIITVIFSRHLKSKRHIVYISFSMAEQKIAKMIYMDLRKANITPISVDNDINIGENIDEGVSGLINKSDIVIIIISDSSLKSKLVDVEFEYAKQLNKKIFPIVYNIAYDEIPNEIKKIKYLDFSYDYDKSINELIKAIKNMNRKQLKQ